MDKNNYCVIMAGGIGSRFWPLSKPSKPKQFLDILGVGRTLLQQTFDRFNQICLPENVYVVTSEEYKDIVREQLPLVPENNVLLEPARRNTAPCIAYANSKIASKNKDAKIIVAPSDHLILYENVFLEKIKTGLEFVSNNDALLTLGITPSRPETGYGYIQIVPDQSEEAIKKVKTFTEKPNLEMAKIFYESGEFFWNSGIFIWSLSTISNAFKQYLPAVTDLFDSGIGVYDTPQETEFINKIYSECQNISIDYGVMEKAENVNVLCADFGWSDLGTWGALYDNMEKDEDSNAITGKLVKTYDTTNCVINASDDKLVIANGLNDYIVVVNDDIVMICKKENEQQIKDFVNDIRLDTGEQFM